jgi:hypothetical protein
MINPDKDGLCRRVDETPRQSLDAALLPRAPMGRVV